MPRMKTEARVAVVLLVVASCSRPAAPSQQDGGGGERPRYGAVMAEIGRRFELAGRAFAAGRFDLASFEVEEMGEAFEGDLARAEPPKEGNAAALPALARVFLETHVPELKKAAAARDRAAFAEAFKRAATKCNECHQASEHGFIEISTALGAAVPSLDPLPGSSAR